ncbi:MAG: LAGLIDADG family homing endonuclease, partial [Solirubrobacteraceae bacterium]
GPEPNLAALSEAVDFCAESIESAGDCKVGRGEFRQHELWASSLPLGRDIHAKARKYPTANAGDMLPLIGTKCGSPTGIPFAFADPGRTVELLNPYDEEHANYTLVISGRSGSGKALDVETPLPTTSGWTTMGQLRLGDELYDEEGRVCRVTGIFDQPPGRPCFEVVFSDGSTIVADGEHRWLTHDFKARKAARYRATTTNQPLDMLGGTSRFRGVTRHRDGRWIAQVGTRGVRHYLGLFPDEETAAAAAQEGRRRLLKSQCPGPRIVTTEEIRRSLRDGKSSNHAIPAAKPLVGRQAELPLAPYTLGVWLGDGSSHHATIFSDDPQVIELVAAEGYEVNRHAAPFAYGISGCAPRVADTHRVCAQCGRGFVPRLAGQRFCSPPCVSRCPAPQRTKFPAECERCGGALGAQARRTFCTACVRATNPNSILRSLGLLRNKHIPIPYLRASEAQRRALLAGLLDTDGSVSPQGTVHFDSTNERLARDVRELALTLGYRATLTTRRASYKGRDCGAAFRVSFTTPDDVFRLERKRQLLRQRSSRHNPERTRWRYIVDVRPVQSRPVRCITIDSPSHLFLAGETMIPTHNTMTANTGLSRSLAAGARAFVIDRAGHYEILTRLIDGAQQIEIGADDSPYALNPWDVPDPAKVSREKIAFLLALHQVMMGGLDARQIGLIGPAIRAVYAKAAQLPGSTPRESMLQDELRAQAREAHDADAVDVAATLRNLADRLSEYCGEGTYAYLLDRETTVPLEAPLVVFDTRRCPESELRLVMFQVMEYVTATVERHWQAHRTEAGKPGAPLFLGRSIMLIDEAWHLISRPETGAYANNLARRARHLGLVLMVMSQQLSDFDTEHGVALLGNSSQQLLLAQNPKEIPFIADTLQLSEREAAELARLKTVKGRHAQMLWLNGTRG